MMNKKLNRNTIHFSLIIAVAAALFTVNLIITLLAQNYPLLSVDLTRGKLFALDPQTVRAIRALEKKVTIHVLAAEETFAETSAYNAQANEVMGQFQKNSGAISLEYVDYVKNPTFAASYPDLIMKHGDILVTAEDTGKHFLVKTEELFNYAVNAGGNIAIVSSKAEEAIYTAIRAVSSDTPLRLSVINGHGEYTMEAFMELLRKNNYVLDSQNLISGAINPAVDAVLIVAPKFDYTEEELQKLEDFLVNKDQYGKTLLYCADAEQPPLPALAVFLREWGVLVGDGAVFETNDKRVYNYHPFYAVADYAEERYAGQLQSIGKPMLMPISRPLRRVFDFRNNYSTRVLLEFAPSTGVRPPDAPANFTAGDAVWHGPIPALMLCRYSIPDRQTGKTAKASHLLVSGSAGMLDAYAVNNPSFSNAEYLVNLLNSLSGRDNDIPFQPKSFAGAGLNLSRTTVNILGLILIVILPAFILGAGLTVWIRRIRS